MWMSDGRDCAGELRQSLSVEDVDGKQDSLSYYYRKGLRFYEDYRWRRYGG